MTGILTPDQRPGPWESIGDVTRRVTRLEAVAPPEGDGGLQFHAGTYGPLNVGDWLSIETTSDVTGEDTGTLLQQTIGTTFRTRSTFTVRAFGPHEGDFAIGEVVEARSDANTGQGTGMTVSGVVNGDDGDARGGSFTGHCNGDYGNAYGLEVQAVTDVTTPGNTSPATGLLVSSVAGGDALSLGLRVEATGGGAAGATAIDTISGRVKHHLAVAGQTFEVYDSSATPIFTLTG